MRAMDSTFSVLGLTAHAYGLCAVSPNTEKVLSIGLIPPQWRWQSR